MAVYSAVVFFPLSLLPQSRRLGGVGVRQPPTHSCLEETGKIPLYETEKLGAVRLHRQRLRL